MVSTGLFSLFEGLVLSTKYTAFARRSCTDLQKSSEQVNFLADLGKKRHFPRIGDKTGTTSKESAGGALILRKQLQESGQTLRADPMCCPS